MQDELLTMKEAAELLKVSEVTIKRYIHNETIPSVKIGGARRIIKNEIWDTFILKMKEGHEYKTEEKADTIASEPENPLLVKREIANEEKGSKTDQQRNSKNLQKRFLEMLGLQ